MFHHPDHDVYDAEVAAYFAENDAKFPTEDYWELDGLRLMRRATITEFPASYAISNLQTTYNHVHELVKTSQNSILKAKIAKRMAEIKPFPEDDPYELARESIVDLEEIVEDGAELHAHLCQVYSACSNAYDVAQRQLDNPLTMDTNRWFSLMYTAKVIRVRTKFRLNVLLQSGIEVTAVKNDLIDYLYKES